MSGQKIGSTAGRELAAATRGVPAATSPPEPNAQNDAKSETPKTPDLKEDRDNKSAEKDDASSKLVDGSKPEGGKSATGGGGGNGNPKSGSTPTVKAKPWYSRGGFIGAAVGTVLGAAVAVIAAPFVVAGIGFGAGGIAAGSMAASMMSSAAIANGGAIAAGSLVATLQSIGAVGFSAAGLAAVGAAGAGVGAAVGTGAGVAVGTGAVVAADMAAGTGNATAEENPRGNAEGGVGAAGAGVGAAVGTGAVVAVGTGAVVAADMAAGNGNATAEEKPRGNAEGGVENVDDVAEDMANLKVDEAQRPLNEELMSIIVSESDGNVRSFVVNSSEPLQRMFDVCFDETGLSPDSVMFEFNGL